MLLSCEKDFDIDVKQNKPQLIVEGYINNSIPLYNYVILGRSQSYFEPDFENIAVSGATVRVTEGQLRADGTYEWDPSTQRQLREIALPQFNINLLPGVYFDPDLVANPQRALIGRPGYHYLLEIEVDENKYTATTAMLPVVPIDSLTIGNYFTERAGESEIKRARVTVHYQDPDTIGNTQLFFRRHWDNQNNIGWGGLGAARYTQGTDDLVNGQYIHLTHSNSYVLGDTVEYFMASVERKVYNFWDSFNEARSNDGPFATPVSLKSTISGPDVIGCFSGFSVSTREIVVE